jgi:ferredoxin
MILYFSGNGNTQFAAERIAQATHDTAVNMADFICGRRDISEITITDTIGIFFPTHAWYAPMPVMQFIARLQIPDGTYRYAISTCGDSIGRGMHRFAKHFSIDAGWTIIMPETYIPLFPLDTDEKAAKKVSDAIKRIDNIAELINSRAKTMDVKIGPVPYFFTYAVNPLFRKFCINYRRFRLDDGCTHCGTCAKVCPMNNISLIDGSPVWQSRCITCMACVHSCPASVIQYGKGTRKRGRYSLRKILRKLF